MSEPELAFSGLSKSVFVVTRWADTDHRVAAKKYDVTEQFHNIAEQLGPPDHEPCGTCDWGGCDEEVVRWRYGDEIGTHLPVCFAHSLEAENARLREQAEALATALADARRWMMATNDYESLSPAGHSLTRDAISTADAALRAYRETPQ